MNGREVHVGVRRDWCRRPGEIGIEQPADERIAVVIEPREHGRRGDRTSSHYALALDDRLEAAVQQEAVSDRLERLARLIPVNKIPA